MDAAIEFAQVAIPLFAAVCPWIAILAQVRASNAAAEPARPVRVMVVERRRVRLAGRRFRLSAA